jgi:hypothetical protein
MSQSNGSWKTNEKLGSSSSGWQELPGGSSGKRSSIGMSNEFRVASCEFFNLPPGRPWPETRNP